MKKKQEDPARVTAKGLERERAHARLMLGIDSGDQFKPEDAACVLKDLNASLRTNLKRKALWEKAAEKHLKFPGDVQASIDLAISFQTWRDLESQYPNWRELQGTPEHVEKVIERLASDGLSWLDIKECLQFQYRVDRAAAFDEQRKKASLENDHAFLSQWAEAGKMLDYGFRLNTSTPGLVLQAWHALGGLSLFRKSPTRQMIEQWVEDRRKEDGNTSKLSDRTWQRTWRDPYIKALLLS